MLDLPTVVLVLMGWIALDAVFLALVLLAWRRRERRAHALGLENGPAAGRGARPLAGGASAARPER